MKRRAARPASTKSRPRKGVAREDGFALLEVLVAFVIGILAVGVLYRGAADGLLAQRIASRYGEAVSRARSHLEQACSSVQLTPTETMATEGDDGGGFRWRLRIRTAAHTTVWTSNLEGNPGAPPPVNVKLYSVSVVISRPAIDQPVHVELDSTCLAALPAAGN